MTKKSKKRVRRLFSVKEELLNKSREAALAAVQIFNNPNISFKSESYIVLMVIAWTYLLHAHYRENKIEYRYFKQAENKRVFDRTKRGAFKYWELERCLDDKSCPMAAPVVQNLKFLIGLRHEIEHQMTTRIDDLLSARFQACCINYHETAIKLFGEKRGIAHHLSVSLQFSSITREQVSTLDEHKDLPPHIKSYITGFDGALPENVYASPQFAYRVIFVPKTANHVNQADQVISFVKADSEAAKVLNAHMTVIKETERPKWLPSRIVSTMNAEGFPRFRMQHHTELWQARKAKTPALGFGVQIAHSWFWYDNWVDEVRNHCKSEAAKYR